MRIVAKLGTVLGNLKQRRDEVRADRTYEDPDHRLSDALDAMDQTILSLEDAIVETRFCVLENDRAVAKLHAILGRLREERDECEAWSDYDDDEVDGYMTALPSMWRELVERMEDAMGREPETIVEDDRTEETVLPPAGIEGPDVIPRRRFLAVCEGGNVRSACLAYVLHDLHHQEAIAIGWRRVSVDTLQYLCEWADTIVIMQSEFLAQIPKEYHAKTRALDVGPDRWGVYHNPELLEHIQGVVAGWTERGYRI